MEVKIASLTHPDIKPHPLWKDIEKDDQRGTDKRVLRAMFQRFEGRESLKHR